LDQSNDSNFGVRGQLVTAAHICGASGSPSCAIARELADSVIADFETELPSAIAGL
jgi:hypothetical protein